jgi:putative redox protein
MGQVQISAYWTGEALNYVGIDSRGNKIAMGGQGNMSPAQMVLLGLAGCMGMDVVNILQKKKQQISDVQVRVIAQQPDDYPKPYQAIEVAFTVKGDQIDPTAVARAIELSEEKYCVVGQTLQSQVQITTSFTVEEAA